MKVTKQITSEQETTVCDFCKGDCQFSADQCLTCGKHACEKCWQEKMRHYELGETFAWSYPKRFSQPCVSRLNFCQEHKPDTLEREVIIALRKTASAEKDLLKYMEWRTLSIGAIQDFINHRERGFDGKTGRK